MPSKRKPSTYQRLKSLLKKRRQLDKKRTKEFAKINRKINAEKHQIEKKVARIYNTKPGQQSWKQLDTKYPGLTRD